MHSTNQKPQTRSFRTILPAILRITFSLILWTLGAATMQIAASQTREHREVRNFPMDRAHIETLQRWVNSGHDEWCRDPQLVASAAVRLVSPQFSESEFELASLPLGGEHSRSPRRSTLTIRSMAERPIALLFAVSAGCFLQRALFAK